MAKGTNLATQTAPYAAQRIYRTDPTQHDDHIPPQIKKLNFELLKISLFPHQFPEKYNIHNNNKLS